MFISLESRYREAIIAIEKVFQDLGVKASIFYITKQEYEGRIGQQKDDTLKNINNEYSTCHISFPMLDVVLCRLPRT